VSPLQSRRAHCYYHYWRPVWIRRIRTGKRRGSWRWKLRCSECLETCTFHTTYPPATHKPT